MDGAPFVPVGRIIKAHGLHGEVSVAPTTGLPFASLVGIEVWFTPPPAVGARSGKLEAVRQGPKGPLLTISGVDSIDAASRLAGSQLLARSAELPAEALEEEPDPTGLVIVDESRGEIGVVDDVIVTGANDVWVVHGDRYGEVLLPVIDDVVLDFDEEQGIVYVRLLPGLIEEE